MTVMTITITLMLRAVILIVGNILRLSVEMLFLIGLFVIVHLKKKGKESINVTKYSSFPIQFIPPVRLV
ncbi:MAG: hypothetical protein KAU38_15490, partial [Desulfobacterales bacterium]|nr:hypothetical protein [Desulfobacterales bacterium]